MGDVVGGDVPPGMVDGDQRHPQGVGRRLGEVHPHQQGADEAGGVGDGHRVDVSAGESRLLQGLIRQAGDGLHVLA